MPHSHMKHEPGSEGPLLVWTTSKVKDILMCNQTRPANYAPSIPTRRRLWPCNLLGVKQNLSSFTPSQKLEGILKAVEGQALPEQWL